MNQDVSIVPHKSLEDLGLALPGRVGLILLGVYIGCAAFLFFVPDSDAPLLRSCSLVTSAFIMGIFYAYKAPIWVPQTTSRVTKMLSIENMEELQAKALAGDQRALAQLQVAKWNAGTPVGAEVYYEKSPIEGKCRLSTVGQAYVLGDDQAVVDLQGIGAVLLEKTEPVFDR